ncbi:MAG: DUF1156 domain-containing protein [Thermoflexaceae bacterium]|nr:DUF1156 domain-containing protein [Thermoflexaceae bacterium]
MNDTPRLIEVAFPLRQASIDSVHEKNVRHGHISTLHIWPARRPLAASRAALIATLLPDPGDDDKRREILERLGGTLRKVQKRKVLPGGRVEFVEAEETVGGILRWGRESGPDLDWFREEIKKAYGGRAPRVLDPFAGGGAIPLEAMRLGCEVTAGDLNPVAWFILKCTLEYPQRLAGQTRPLPAFALKDAEFMEAFLKARGEKGKTLQRSLAHYGLGEDTANYFAGWDPNEPAPDADLAWHVRAWGRWVLERAKADLSPYYPTVDGKATVAYLWARTVKCKSCRGTIPLLKTRWLCKKDNKRILLNMQPNWEGTGVVFSVEADVPQGGTNAAQRREHDKRIGSATMSRTGAACPLCPAMMTMEDIRHEGISGRLGSQMTAVVVDGAKGKEYRAPMPDELQAVEAAGDAVPAVFANVPFGVPDEPLPAKEALGFRVPLYGLDRWDRLFTPRQLLALGTFVLHTRATRDAMTQAGYSSDWGEAVVACLAMGVDRLADRSSTICRPDPSPTQSGIVNTFSRFALPMTWDFIEGTTTAGSSGGFTGSLEWVAKYVEHSTAALVHAPIPSIHCGSAIEHHGEHYDAIITDPPYYDAIPYSDLMDFFYVWLRRTVAGLSPEMDEVFSEPLGPKWNSERQDGELIDDASRFGGDRQKSKAAYEEGMYSSFVAAQESLAPDGKFIIVFAHKHPDAWETLVGAIIRAGFVVDGSWPIQTEMGNRTRALSGAALSSSVWMVCKQRSAAARPGWDNIVVEEMRHKITTRLRRFWDDGIRGPDFVWAATGPALEAYSKHPIVKKANEPGKLLEVHEFLQQVRRMVVDFVVGRVLTGGEGSEETNGLDDVTTYYLLHRNDFQLGDAPAGPCILYAVSCNLSDKALADDHDILARSGGQEPADEDLELEEELGGEEVEEGTGSKLRLKAWTQRRRKSMGYEGPNGRPAPLIDQAHRLMHLWKAGDVTEVDEYLDEHGLRSNVLFHHLVQALIELASHDRDREERSILESISNHLQTRGVAAPRAPKPVQAALALE